MVATPRFHMTQDASRVFVHVRVPFVRVSEMEFHVEGHDFTFYCKPYLLKLHFPHEVVDDDLAKAVYDPNQDNGTIVVHLPKKEPGQEFPDLDMLTKLLQPQRPPVDLKAETQQKAPLIEVLESSSSSSPSTLEPIGDLREETKRLNDLINGRSSDSSVQTDAPSRKVQADSSLLGLETAAETAAAPSVKLDGLGVDQEPAQRSAGVRVTSIKPSYGFNNAYSDFFRAWHGHVSEILSLPDPEHLQPDQRHVLREAAEEQQFDVERYLMDFANAADDMYFQLAMEFEPFWTQYPVLAAPVLAPAVKTADKQVKTVKPLIVEVETTAMQNTIERLDAMTLDASTASPPSPPSTVADGGVVFTTEEQELLLRLPRKEFLLAEDSSEEAHVLGGLVDILIGFVYEQLTTQGDSGVESTWTVSIVSPTLSWLDTTADLRDVVRSAIRRILTFPFLRQYDLALHCVREASEILKRGKRVVLRALLTLYRIVEKSETQYLLNPLYVQDYCVWIQSLTDDRLQRASAAVDAHLAAFSKADTGWALDELERSLLEASDKEEEDNSSESSSSESSDSDEYDDSSSEEDASSSSDDENEASVDNSDAKAATTRDTKTETQ